MKKKILSLLTTFCMMLSMIVGSNATILAADADTGSVTIKGLKANVTYEVYKIIDLNIDENGTISLPMYTWNKDMIEYIKKALEWKPSDGQFKEEVPEGYLKLESDRGEIPDYAKEITKFYFDVSKVLRADPDASQKAVRVGTSQGDSVTLDGLSQGQYLVLASDGVNTETANIYYPSVFNILQNDEGTIEPAEITMKNKPIDIEKTVDSKPSHIGEVKTYTITSDLPVFPGIEQSEAVRRDKIQNATQITYIIGDTLSKGLTLDSASIKVFIGNSVDPLTKDTDYTLNLNPEGGATFTITPSSDILYNNQGEKIKVTYEATVNENAIVKDNLKNTASVEFSNDPFDRESTKTITTEEEVYTYNLKFTKVDEDNNNIKLENVVFELSTGGKALWFKKEGLDYVLSENQENPGAGYTTELKTGVDGIISIKGLDADITYELKETKASSDDYVLPSDPVTITLKDGTGSVDADGKLDEEGTKVEGSIVVADSATITTDTATFAFTLSNKKVGELDLPITGGAGTLMFTIGGLAVMGGAVYLFVSNKKKHAK